MEKWEDIQNPSFLITNHETNAYPPKENAQLSFSAEQIKINKIISCVFAQYTKPAPGANFYSWVMKLEKQNP